MKQAIDKIDTCTTCNNLRLVVRYKDEWVCDVCRARLSALRGNGLERIATLRKEIWSPKSNHGVTISPKGIK